MFKGWSNSERALAVGLAYAIVILGLISGYFYHHEGYYDTQADAQQNSKDWIGWFDVTAQWTMAIAAIVLFVWTRKTLMHAEQTSADALKASTAANEAYVAVEGGRMAYLGAAFSADEPFVIDCALKNIGNTPVTVFSIVFHVQTVKEVADLEWLPMPGRNLYCTILESRGVVASPGWQGDGVTFTMQKALELPGVNIAEWWEDYVLFIHIRAQYETVAGECRAMRATIRYSDKYRKFRLFSDERFTYDLTVKKEREYFAEGKPKDVREPIG